MAFLKVGLTGGIATGKSHVLRRIAQQGIPTIDADELSRTVVAPPSPALDAVVQRFGREVLTANGDLDRKALGQIVFHDAAARRDLEAIIHPAVYAAIHSWSRALDAEYEDRVVNEIAAGTRSPNAPLPTTFVVADVPLLYETGKSGDFDRVIVTICPEEEQIRRLIARDGITEAEALHRLTTQWPTKEKAAHADYVIETSGSVQDTDRQTDEILTTLRRGAE
jgi:dephospho-CoA kinase